MINDIYVDNLVSVPIVGRVRAGIPVEFYRDYKGEISIDQELLGGAKAYVLQVVGESMIEDGIKDGDYVVVREQHTADDGDIVIACIEGECTIKRFYHTENGIRLDPANCEMSPIYINDGEFEIQGKVISLKRNVTDHKGLKKLSVADRNLRPVDIKGRVVRMIDFDYVPEPDYLLEHIGKIWRVVYEGQETTINDTVGMKYLAWLLEHPNESISATKLRSLINGNTENIAQSSGIEVIDYDASEEYQQRLTEITDEISEIEANNDLSSRLETLYAEQEKILELLKSAHGLGGRKRNYGSSAQRDYNSIHMAINRVCKYLKANHNLLYSHIVNSIKQGKIYSYSPKEKISWQIS